MNLNQFVRHFAYLHFMLINVLAFAIDNTPKHVKNAQIRCGAYGEQGIRDHMEDSHFYGQLDGIFYAAVFDGCGGDAVSKHLADKTTGLHNTIKKKLHECQALDTALEQAYFEMNEELFGEEGSNFKIVGSTAATVLIDQKNNQLISANIGDSEIVLISATGSPEISHHHTSACNENFRRTQNSGRGTGN